MYCVELNHWTYIPEEFAKRKESGPRYGDVTYNYVTFDTSEEFYRDLVENAKIQGKIDHQHQMRLMLGLNK